LDDYIGWPIENHFAGRGIPIKELAIRTQPGDPHAAIGYLIHPWTARSIASAWCGAFQAPATAPAACRQVTDVDSGMRDP
jgi:hypothetical protein